MPKPRKKAKKVTPKKSKEVNGHWFDRMESRFSDTDAKFDLVFSKLNSMEAQFSKMFGEIHRVALLVEEQNARNKFVLDGYASLHDRQAAIELEIAEIKKSNRSV